MKLNKKNTVKIIFYIFILLELLTILYVSFHKHNVIPNASHSLYRMNNGWFYLNSQREEASINLPAFINTNGNHSVTIYRKFASMDNQINCIGILTSHQEITAYIDGIIIYHRDIHDDPRHYFNVPSGSVMDLIQLPPKADGKILTLVITSKYPEYAGQISEIYAGTQASILLQFIETHGTSFVLSAIIFVLGVIMLILHSFIKRLLHTNRSLYYLGWFTLIASLWFLSESRLPQLFISNTDIISTITYLSFMTIPIPILLFLAEIDNYYYKKTIPLLIYIILGNNLILVLLQFFNIFDFHDTIGYNRLVIFLILGYSLVHMWLDFLIHKNKQIRIFLHSATMLFVFGFLEFIFFQKNTLYPCGGFFRYGFLLFLMCLAWDAMRKVVDAVKLGEKATQYKLLATRDSLTNCRNRAAYERDMLRIDLSKNVTIFMADMNNMKEVNDTHGHHAGDEVVILCSQCLTKVFGRRVYRIGGDEFLCIEYDLSQSNIEHMIAEFSAECAKANDDSPYKFDVSIGFATYDKALDSTIIDTVKRADVMMYEIKEKMKKA